MEYSTRYIQVTRRKRWGTCLGDRLWERRTLMKNGVVGCGWRKYGIHYEIYISGNYMCLIDMKGGKEQTIFGQPAHHCT